MLASSHWCLQCWKSFILKNSLLILRVATAGATISVLIRGATFGNTSSGLQQILKLWSQHMKGNITMMYRQQEAAAITLQMLQLLQTLYNRKHRTKHTLTEEISERMIVSKLWRKRKKSLKLLVLCGSLMLLQLLAETMICLELELSDVCRDSSSCILTRRLPCIVVSNKFHDPMYSWCTGN